MAAEQREVVAWNHGRCRSAEMDQLSKLPPEPGPHRCFDLGPGIIGVKRAYTGSSVSIYMHKTGKGEAQTLHSPPFSTHHSLSSFKEHSGYEHLLRGGGTGQ